MLFSGFFIDRPIFAGVLSMLIFIAGLISIFTLPISEYPEVVPPSIVVRAYFPGANPKVLAETIAAPIEEQINGVENMLYMSSQSTADGLTTITVTFEIGTDPNLALTLVRSRVAQATPRLPEITRQLGITTVKSSPNLTMVVHIKSPNDRYDMLYLRNYAVLNIKDELARIRGIGDVQIFGAGDYAMRIWLNPEKIAERDLSASQVVNAIREQNISASAGVIGGPPYLNGVEVQLPINVKGRFETAEEFEEIIIKTGDNGAITRLKDVARVELGAQQYALRSLLDNKQAAAIPIFQSPDANALQISTDVRAKMESLKKNFPSGIDYEIVYDPTVFVRESIESVIYTLLEAVALVVLVVIVFLQTWRASIIPLLAVPVSIVGAFFVMWLMGFSINVLSLFGLILAIGIVVDDAIIVVENVQRNISEGLSPRDASFQAMREVTGPVIATTLVLVAVFVPIAFLSGLTGQFYRQFALTIAISTVISSINSLTLSPALCRLLLKSEGQDRDWLSRLMDILFGWFFKLFNIGFGFGASVYSFIVRHSVGHRLVMLLLYSGLLYLTYDLFQRVPPGFIPQQDKQYLIGFTQLPEGATLDRTEEVVRKMSDIALQEPGVKNAVGFPGLSIAGFINSSNSGIVFLPLDPFDERTDPSLNALAIAGRLQQKFAAIDDAFVFIFPPPAVIGLGTVGGFKLQLEDRNDMGYEALNDVLNQVKGQAYQTPELTGIFSSYQINVPQLYADLDRTKAKQLGLNIDEIFTTMQIYLGSLYINDFNQFGKTYQVIAQADKAYRSNPEDITRLEVKNNNGEMVPLGAVLSVEESYGPQNAQRYNAFRSADLTGAPAPGFSSGEAQDAIVDILEKTLPQGMDFEWTELTYQQILAGNSAVLIFPLCILLVYLVLAAQYESLTLPVAIILIVPMSLLSAIIGVWYTEGDNNIFTQISLFVLAGLATKNAILIVEFARELELEGREVLAAAIEASQLRLRPILMTSIAFIMGVLPMATSTGAGAEMRITMGIAVLSGMIGVTLFGLLLTPVFYVLIRKLETRR